MANHENRNWQRQWKMSNDGRTATHENGVVVTFNGDRAHVDPASSAMLGEKIAAEEGTGRHVGAHIYKLVTQAEMLLKKRSQH